MRFRQQSSSLRIQLASRCCIPKSKFILKVTYVPKPGPIINRCFTFRVERGKVAIETVSSEEGDQVGHSQTLDVFASDSSHIRVLQDL